jgi:hypothetical protein
VINDLLWLTHEGYVIEYADGRLESVPQPKNPPKPAEEKPAATEVVAEVVAEVVPEAVAPADATPVVTTEEQAPAGS